MPINLVKTFAEDPAKAARQLREEYDLRLAVQKDRLEVQDWWLLWYLMVDTAQTNQPLTRTKYWSPQIPSIVDTARRVLARNPIRYRAVTDLLDRERKDQEPVRALENILHGLLYDIDTQMIRRGEMRSRHAVAFHTLVRGQWAYRLHLTTEAKSSTGSPIFYEQLDPRLTLAAPDNMGVESAIYFQTVTLGQLVYIYPEQLNPLIDKARALTPHASTVDYAFLHAPLLLLEWSSRDEIAAVLDVSGLPEQITEGMDIDANDTGNRNRYLWLDKPRELNLNHSVIQTGNANGLPVSMASQKAAEDFIRHSVLRRVPTFDGSGDTTVERQWTPLALPAADLTMQPAMLAVDPAASLMGRSIFSNVAHMIPEWNEMMSLLKDATVSQVRGTFMGKSRDGTPFPVKIGAGDVNWMTLQESLEELRRDIGMTESLATLQIIKREIADATLDLDMILGGENQQTGTQRARSDQGALTALIDYKDAMENWATSVADSFSIQFRAVNGKLGDWKVRGREPGLATRFFVIDIDDKVREALLDGAEPPTIEASVKAAFPVDMIQRINMAKAAIDPNNPVMSLIEALDLIMEVDDAHGAADEILRDIGNRNPTIQLAKIADAFKRAGAPELADMIMGDQFRGAFNNERQQGATLAPSGASKGIRPETLPPGVSAGQAGGT